MKKCKGCKIPQDETNFPLHKLLKDGSRSRRGKCTTCFNNDRREARRRLRLSRGQKVGVQGSHVNSREDITRKVRVCKVCNETKKFMDFEGTGKQCSGGHEYRRHECKPCHLARKKVERADAIREFMDFKKTLECMRCGYSKDSDPDFVVQHLQFHHPVTNKDFNVSDMISTMGYRLSSKRLIKEVGKCDVVCGRCHDVIHYKDRQ